MGGSGTGGGGIIFAEREGGFYYRAWGPAGSDKCFFLGSACTANRLLGYADKPCAYRLCSILCLFRPESVSGRICRAYHNAGNL
jgi:hypothetical protein